MKEDAYKSLCSACFSVYFQCCRCIFCKDCIHKWKEAAKPIENSADVICGFCNKQTDPKINSFQDLKAAQSFAFLFAEPETLFERQIDIIKFQRRQSQKYIQYLQKQISFNEQELSLIYQSYPQIKKDISYRKVQQPANEEDQRKIASSCINFKGVQDEANQKRNVSNEQYRTIQQPNQYEENIKGQILDSKGMLLNRNAKQIQDNQRQQQQIMGMRKQQLQNESCMNAENTMNYEQPAQYMFSTPNVYNQATKNVSNHPAQKIVQPPMNVQKNPFATNITSISNTNISKGNSNSGGMGYQDFMQRQQMPINYKQSNQSIQNSNREQEQRKQHPYYEPSLKNSKDSAIDDNLSLLNTSSSINQYHKPSHTKENINTTLNQVYASYNSNYKTQQLQLQQQQQQQQQPNIQQKFKEQYYSKQNK